MLPQIVDGDLLEQPVEAIVNAWNRGFVAAVGTWQKAARWFQLAREG
jgi:hypothetical protein